MIVPRMNPHAIPNISNVLIVNGICINAGKEVIYFTS